MLTYAVARTSLYSHKSTCFTCFTGIKVQILTFCTHTDARSTGIKEQILTLYWHKCANTDVLHPHRRALEDNEEDVEVL